MARHKPKKRVLLVETLWYIFTPQTAVFIGFLFLVWDATNTL
jgi:hypothetical protein